MNGTGTLLLLGSIGHWELLVILVVVLLVFGARLPEVMRSLGRGVTQFRKGLHDIEDEIMVEKNVPPTTTHGTSDGARPTAGVDGTEGVKKT